MITEIIKPISLLRGTHVNTAKTGQGCFMNVIAYLNGERQITDQSDCVCYVVRPIAIWLNDYLKDDERHLMIPFIERAMGSRSDDKNEVIRRLKLVVEFSDAAAKSAAEYAFENVAKSAAKYAKSAAKYAAKYAKSTAKSVEYAAKYAKSAAEYATNSAAEYAAKSVEYAAIRKQLIEAAFEFLDEALPKKIIIENVIVGRAKQLVSL